MGRDEEELKTACAEGGRLRRGARWRRVGKGAAPAAAVEAACAICRCCSRLKARLLSCPVRGQREVRGESREMSLVRVCASYPPCHHPRLCPRLTCSAGGREDGGRGGVTLRGDAAKRGGRSSVADTRPTSTPPAPPNLPSSSLSAPARGNASFRLSFPPHIRRRHLRSRRLESARTHASSQSRQAVCTHMARAPPCEVRGEVSQHGIPCARTHMARTSGWHVRRGRWIGEAAARQREELPSSPPGRKISDRGKHAAGGGWNGGAVGRGRVKEWRAKRVEGGHDLWRRTLRRRSPWGGRVCRPHL